jgi:hypothetical protein
MFWAGFGENTRTGLIPLNGDPVLQKLSVNMPKRVEAVIAAQGWYTKY